MCTFHSENYMPSADNLIRLLKDKPARQLISDLYGKEKIEMNIARFDKLIVHYLDLFGDGAMNWGESAQVNFRGCWGLVVIESH